MKISVRELLTPLRRTELLRLCRLRELALSGTKQELLSRLARSYRGKLNIAIDDLRKQDLHTISYELEDQFHLPHGWKQWNVHELRRAFFAKTVNVQQAPNIGVHSQSISLFSSNLGYLSDGVQRLSIDNLRHEALTAERTTIISAYYGIDTLRELTKGCKGKVRIVLNGLAGRNLKAQIDRLKEFQNSHALNRYIEIKLGFSAGVFHTKLYLFEDDGRSSAWLGSANATAAGLKGHNEESLDTNLSCSFIYRILCRRNLEHYFFY